jgi:hypothetical protein
MTKPQVARQRCGGRYGGFGRGVRLEKALAFLSATFAF